MGRCIEGNVFKEDLCIGERRLENLMDVLVPKAYRERLFVEPAATTALTMHVNVREKAHLHFDRARAGAGLAAAAFDVEGKPTRQVARHAGRRGRGEELANSSEKPT